MRDSPARRWLSLHGDGAIKTNDEISELTPRRIPGGIGQPRNERVAVSAISRVVTADRTCAVRVVGVSATTALVIAPMSLGYEGQVVDLFLPILGNREIRVTAGIVIAEPVRQGQALTLHFMIPEVELRRQLNELVALLLVGDTDSAHKQPRVIYDVPVRYGARGERVGHLEELSLCDLTMRVWERLPPGASLRLTIPTFNGTANLTIAAHVTGQKLSREGGYHTSVVFDALDDGCRVGLSHLIADLMCR